MAGFAPLFLGQSDGGRIVRFGAGLSQVVPAGTEPVVGSLTTHAIAPAGAAGQCVFTGLFVPVRVSHGCSILITPIVDGIEQPGQVAVASGGGLFTLQARFRRRGSFVAARYDILTVAGDVEILTAHVTYVLIRETE